MSWILNEDIVNDDNVSSITHTTASGTINDISDVDLIISRSIIENYRFTVSGFTPGTQTITITLDDALNAIDCVSLQGAYYLINQDQNLEIELLNQFDALLYTTTIPTSERSRTIDSNSLLDTTWVFPQVSGVRKIVIKFDYGLEVIGIGDYSGIGKVFAGKAKELCVDPLSIRYSFKTQGSKLRSEGAQIIADKNNSYMKCSFQTIPTKESSVVSDFFDINYVSSVSEPIIFVPQEGESIVLYGTQEKPNTTSMKLVRDSETNEWMYVTQFFLEEEF